ncbi:MAG TPA: gluconate:H+ symporter [Sphingobium sp.]|nr:gluconate:H+ symporter [Sphingobium sp.]
MSDHDIVLIGAAVAGIALAVLLIIKGRLHPFLALLCGAFSVGLLAGIPSAETARAVQKGAGDILGGTGLVVALGLSLGAMLQISNGAASLARWAMQFVGRSFAPYASLLVALVIGLPLFFETGLVLLLPIIAAAAAAICHERDDTGKLQLLLPALAGLSIVHALVPPHPGPLLAVDMLKADLSRTIVYGLIVAVPTGIIAGPLLARYISRGVTIALPAIEQVGSDMTPPRKRASLAIILMPVVLISLGQVVALMPPATAARFGWMAAASEPVLALLLTNLAALPLLFGRRMLDAQIQGTVWKEAMLPAGAILLSIGAGGALKQVLVSAGLSDMLARLATMELLSPLLLAWLIAVAIRLATGSATVATITTAGVVPGLVAATGASPEWTVLAIGAGSVFFSHVNDPGFWLVRSYLGMSTADTFRTWSVMETVISVCGLIFVLLGSYLL